MSVSPLPGQWMLNTNGVQTGPYDDAVFRMMYAQGQIPLNAMVWQVGMQSWVPVTQALGVMPRPGGMPPMMGGYPPPSMGYPQQMGGFPQQLGGFPQQGAPMQPSSGSSGSKSRALAAIIGFCFPGLHRVYLGKGAGLGAAIFAVVMIFGAVPLLFGLPGLACGCGMAFVIAVASVIDAMTVQLDA